MFTLFKPLENPVATVLGLCVAANQALAQTTNTNPQHENPHVAQMNVSTVMDVFNMIGLIAVSYFVYKLYKESSAERAHLVGNSVTNI